MGDEICGGCWRCSRIKVSSAMTGLRTESSTCRAAKNEINTNQVYTFGRAKELILASKSFLLFLQSLIFDAKLLFLACVECYTFASIPRSILG